MEKRSQKHLTGLLFCMDVKTGLNLKKDKDYLDLEKDNNKREGNLFYSVLNFSRWNSNFQHVSVYTCVKIWSIRFSLQFPRNTLTLSLKEKSLHCRVCWCSHFTVNYIICKIDMLNILFLILFSMSLTENCFRGLLSYIINIIAVG